MVSGVCRYTVQSIKQSGSITTMKEWIEKKLREGFYITSIAGGTDSYVVVASKVNYTFAPTSFTPQIDPTILCYRVRITQTSSTKL